MEKIRKSISTEPISCFLAFLVLLISCSAPDENIVLENENSFNKMSGDQIFRSILFKEGVLGKKMYNKDDIELINGLDLEVFNRFELLKNEIVNDINRRSPSYFDDFKKNVLTNDHNLLLNTFLNAKLLVKKTIQVRFKISDDKLNSYYKMNLKRELQKQNFGIMDKEVCVAVLVVVLVFVLKVVLIPVIVDNNEITRLEAEQTVNRIISINQ
ncbi:hypothetical protein TPENAI_60460 [Tenacibaculum litopenaei]|uniref:hypothetical protein n=1 Tax=Tenacibaculum litopenaei TaxID=396016 RepID=UPI00389328AD